MSRNSYEPTGIGNSSIDKGRKTPPFSDFLRNVEKTLVSKLHKVMRGPDLPQYTYQEQAQILKVIAKRLENMPEKEYLKEPQFPCHICERVFAASVQLKRHLHIHGPRNYRCDYPGCTWTFVYARDRDRHKERHGIISRVFKCLFPGCGKLMNRRDNARHHIRTVHKIEAGEVNKFIEVVPIDTDAPGEEKVKNVTDRGASVLTGIIKSNPTEGYEAEFSDLFRKYTNMYEGDNSEKEGSSSEDWLTGEEVTVPVKPEPQVQVGVQRNQSIRLKDRVRKAFYTATRPRPPRFNKKPDATQKDQQVQQDTKDPEPKGLDVEISQRRPGSAVEERPCVVTLTEDKTKPTKPSESPPPPTRAPPQLPDVLIQGPPVAPTRPPIPTCNSFAGPSLPSKEPDAPQSGPSLTPPSPKVVQVSPTFVTKLQESFQKKLQLQ